MASTSEIKELLRDRIPIFEKILEIAKQPGISIGVLCHGEPVFLHNIGHRNLEGKKPANEDTLYCIGSLTKAFITTSIGQLVADKKFSWNTPVSSIVPGFQNKHDVVITTRMTVKDLLSHRSGLTSLDQLIQGLQNQVTVEKSEVVKVINALPVKNDFRTAFWYCNILFSLAGHIIERFSGEHTWSAFTRKRIWEPLGMMRTTASLDVLKKDQNVATPYVTLTDGSMVAVNTPVVSDTHMDGEAGGIRSSVSDLLKWCKANLDSLKDKSANSLKEVGTLTSATTIMNPENLADGVYCLGWVRQSTPAKLGPISLNRRSRSPLVGASTPSVQIISHQGDVIGYTGSLYLLPDTDSAVVTLTNGIGFTDAADWVAQDLIQSICGLAPSVDFVAEAQAATQGFLSRFEEEFRKPLEKARKHGTRPGPLKDYVGEYRLDGYDLVLQVQRVPDDALKLCMVVNRCPDQVHTLSHFHLDTFCLLPESYDEALTKGYMGTFGHWEEYLVSFNRLAEGDIGSLTWRFDGVDVSFPRKV